MKTYFAEKMGIDPEEYRLRQRDAMYGEEVRNRKR